MGASNHPQPEPTTALAPRLDPAFGPLTRLPDRLAPVWGVPNRRTVSLLSGLGIQAVFYAARFHHWWFVAAGAGLLGTAAWQGHRWWIIPRLRMLRTRPATPSEIATGEAVGRRRFVGVVEPDEPPFIAVGTNLPAVFVRTMYLQANGEDKLGFNPPRENDVRGVRFRVRLADGTAVRVHPSMLKILGRPTRLRHVPETIRRALGAATRGFRLLRDRIYQQRIAPGDHVELVGRLQIEISPEGEASPGRGTPVLRTILPEGDPEIPIRLVKRPATTTTVAPPALPAQSRS